GGCGVECRARGQLYSLVVLFYPCCFLAPLQYAARDVVSREPSAESATLFRILFYGNISGAISIQGPFDGGGPSMVERLFPKRRNMREFERIPG
ncbi:hypothetical protein JTE90_012547, partial [Oedothorax gibbosus]